MDAVESREKIIDALHRELIGPDPRGSEILVGEGIHITNQDERYLPFVVAGSRSEILKDKPTLRYGAAVIYPNGTMDHGSEIFDEREEGDTTLETDYPLQDDVDDDDELRSPIREYGDDDPLDMEVDSSLKLKQSSLGLSFFAELEPGDVIRVSLDAGRYEVVNASVAGKKGISNQKWWIRHPVKEIFEVQVEDNGSRVNGGTFNVTKSLAPLELRATVRVRPPSPTWPTKSNGYICTTSLINTSTGAVEDTICLFQTVLLVEVVRNGLVQSLIGPYPEREESIVLENDSEARSISLLYRNNPTFAIGHGCSATWTRPTDGLETRTRATIRGEFLPVVEIPSMTPLIKDSSGVLLSVPMGPRAGPILTMME